MRQWIFIEQVCVQLPTSADNVTLLAFAAAERRAAVRRVIDRYLLPAGPTAANPPQRYAVVDRWDRQTDRRTPYRFTDPAHTVRALSDMTVCVSGARRWLQSVVRLDSSFDFGAIYIVCLFMSCASLIILFLHFFLTYLLTYLYL